MGKVKFVELGDAIQSAIEEYSDEMMALKEDALDEAADFMVQEFNRAAPIGNTGKLSCSFSRTNKYKGVRYVASDRLNDKGIPVANLLEFGKKKKPFMRKTFDRSVEKITSIIKNKLNKE